ncbi:hypothetical protein EXE41_17740 [Halorubrum sp. SD690R]|uniref:hypothetical protein n=1 Tax=Halorubrum sp. SD690R TaxID=2518117 RepID=UPI0010F6BEFF|nr:hypothetical protein [Halorubrum sp. SD690R]TKX42084.1 hypothetical protein EXE41_17740 [Halorubrum sp. SD690R]
MTENCSPNPDVINPEMKLEDVRYKVNANTCDGYGRSTASGRGYNAERLVNAIFHESGRVFRASIEPYVDAYVPGEISYDVEVKSCVARYQGSSTSEPGRYGQFRIWKHHHDQLIAETTLSDSRTAIYFFVVYSVRYGIEEEVGKLLVPAEVVDDVLDNWSLEEHVTMGEQKTRQISWHLLLKRLGVSTDRFKSEDIIDLTNE